nr:MAG TPA: hypothetical protein [Caudoviricetes sp.]
MHIFISYLMKVQRLVFGRTYLYMEAGNNLNN